jgi:hypothetical protein
MFCHVFGRKTVVRIHLPASSRTYAYRCRDGARIGDIVRVVTPYSGVVESPVVGFGRGGWWGCLKPARVVAGPDGEVCR